MPYKFLFLFFKICKICKLTLNLDTKIDQKSETKSVVNKIDEIKFIYKVWSGYTK